MRFFALLSALSVIAAATASAKEIRPGELRLCGARHCRLVSEPARARAFSSLLWGQSPIPRAQTPLLDAPVYQLRFRGGPSVALLSATAIRVHGLNCGRFQRGKWYRLPSALRGLTRGLTPKHLRARAAFLLTNPCRRRRL